MHHSQRNTLYILLFLFLACSEWDLERIGFTQVITIGAIEVGSNSAFLIGDIEDIRMASITETGFVLSSVAKDDQSLTLENSGVVQVRSPGLDTISDDRAFAARATGLNQSTTYTFRAYVKLADEVDVIYGNIEQFSTTEIELKIVSVQKSSESCMSTANIGVEIDGTFLGEQSALDLVYSDNISDLLSEDISNERIEVNASGSSGQIDISLEIICNRNYFVQVTTRLPNDNPIKSNILGFSTIENGSFIPLASFIGSQREFPLQFDLDSKIVIGGGDNGLDIFSDFYQYDMAADQWVQIPGISNLSITRGSAFSLGSQGYIANGRIPFEGCFDLSVSVRYCPEFISASDRLCPRIGGESYTYETENCFSFIPCDCYNSEVYRYSANDESWSIIDSFPGSNRKSNVTIDLGEEIYLATGYRQNRFAQSLSACEGCITNPLAFDAFDFKTDMWTLNPNSGQWNSLESFPGAGRTEAVGFGADGKAYIGLGFSTLNVGKSISGEILERNDFFSDFYEFDPSGSNGSRWRRISDFPILESDKQIGFGSFSHGYVLVSYDSPGDNRLEMWQFDPGSGSKGEWTPKGLPGNITGTPQSATTVGNITFLYFNNPQDNFRMYVPEL